MNNYTELRKYCETFKKGFDSIEEFAKAWGHSNKPIRKAMQEIFDVYVPNGPATEYALNNAHIYMLGEIFQSQKTIRLLKAKHKKVLSSEGYQTLTILQNNPGFWCYFTIKEDLSDDFWTITDHMSGEEHLLYSKAITTMLGWKDAEYLSFLCLMLPNGQCLQTIGIIKYYRLPVRDVLFYCSLFQPEVGLQAIQHKHFVQFSQLDTINGIIPIKNGIHETGVLWQPFTLPSFASEKLGGRWVGTTVGDHHRYTLRILDASMLGLPNLKLFETTPSVMAGSIIKDNTTGEMILFTNTEAAYIFYSTLLNRSYPLLQLPPKPAIFINLALQVFLTITNLPVPWSKFHAILAHKGFNEQEEEQCMKEGEILRDKYKAIVKDETNSYTKDMMPLFLNEQLPSLFLYASEVGEIIDIGDQNYVDLLKLVELATTGEDEDQLGEAFDIDAIDNEDIFFIVPTKDKIFELKDCPKPDGWFGDVLYHSLSESLIFDANDVVEAQRLFSSLASEDFSLSIKKEGLYASIQALFFSHFEREFAFPLMNALFWILFHKGRQWLPVRSYALEILKWLPSQTIRYYVDQEEFIEDLSKFIRRTLAPRGICSLKARPTSEEVKEGLFVIKATEAFTSLLTVKG